MNLVAGEKPPDVYSEIAARLVIVCDNFSFVMPSFSKNYDGCYETLYAFSFFYEQLFIVLQPKKLRARIPCGHT